MNRKNNINNCKSTITTIFIWFSSLFVYFYVVLYCERIAFIENNVFVKLTNPTPSTHKKHLPPG